MAGSLQAALRNETRASATTPQAGRAHQLTRGRFWPTGWKKRAELNDTRRAQRREQRQTLPKAAAGGQPGHLLPHARALKQNATEPEAPAPPPRSTPRGRPSSQWQRRPSFPPAGGGSQEARLKPRSHWLRRSRPKPRGARGQLGVRGPEITSAAAGWPRGASPSTPPLLSSPSCCLSGPPATAGAASARPAA